MNIGEEVKVRNLLMKLKPKDQRRILKQIKGKSHEESISIIKKEISDK